jgi:hypothetical protein
MGDITSKQHFLRKTKMNFDFNTIDALYDAIFGCEYNPVGCTIDPAIVPASGTIEIISDDMEVAKIYCDIDGHCIDFDYYSA